MVRAWSAGSLCAVISRQRGIRDPGQREQYDGECHAGDQHLPHNHRQQHHEHHERHVREPECARRGDGGAAACVRERSTGGECEGPGQRTADRGCADKWASCGRSHARKRTGRKGCVCGSRGRASGSGSEPAGCRQENSAAAAGAFCETAAGSGSASRTAAGKKRSADAASGRCGSGASEGEGGASGQEGDTQCRTSGPSAEWGAAQSTCCAASESTG